jgi:hypothetical protein
MNMVASVAGATKHGNYIILQTCHYKDCAKTTFGVMQVVDSPSVCRTGAAENGVAASKLGGLTEMGVEQKELFAAIGLPMPTPDGVRPSGLEETNAASGL